MNQKPTPSSASQPNKLGDSGASQPADSVSSGIELKDITVVAGNRTLLDKTNAHFPAREISLIVGPSGVGKSILLRMMAGLLARYSDGIQFDGDVLVESKPARNGAAGVVFQSFALFDELSPMANLDFAQSCGGKHASELGADELLEQLRVPKEVPTSRLSGGQRQRLAIARTLAYNPPAILYDEPTSGLDPSTGQQVAELIRRTHIEHGKTSVVVTHDYHSLMPIADRIYLLDPVAKKLVEVPREDWEQIPARLDEMQANAAGRDEKTKPESIGEKVQSKLKGFFVGTTGVFTAALFGLLSLIPIWKSPKWGVRYLLHYARLVAGPTAWFYLLAAGAIIGFVVTYFTFKFLPYSTYTEPLLIEDLLTAMGFSLYRIFVPVLATILIAARCGAAVTSDVGGRQFGNQIDAVRTFGNNPRNLLLTPIVWSFLIGTPVLNFVAYYMARLTSMLTFVLSHPERGPDFWDYHFHRGLEVLGQYPYRGFGWLMGKLICCALGTAIIAYYQGRRPKYSTTDVSRSVTSTILWATLFVLLVHFVYAFFEYEGLAKGAAAAVEAAQAGSSE